MTSYRATAFAVGLLLALSPSGTGMAYDAQLAQATSPATGKDADHGHGAGPEVGKGQGMGPGMMGPGMMGPGMMGGGMMAQGMGPQMMESHVEGRIAFLKTELKITPAQTKLWDAYADTLRASAKQMSGMQDKMRTMMTATSLPDRLNAAETVMSERLDAFKKVRVAILPLYAAFTDEQKKVADELMPVMGMGMMGM